MARVDLRCASCGYMFFVADVQLSKPGGVKCPSCLAPVGISGPVEGGPARKKTVRVLQAEPDRGEARTKMWIGLAAGGVLAVVGVVFMVFSGSGRPGDEREMNRRLNQGPPSSGTPKPIVGDRTRPAAPIAAKPINVADPPLVVQPGSSAPAAPPKGPEAPAEPAAPGPAAPAAGPLPEDVVKGVREEIHSLKDWHAGLAISGPEKSRLDALMAAGKGEAADVEFLRGLLGGPRLRAVREEAAMIRETLERLSKEAMDGLPVDKVLMNDGRVLHGKILEETGEVVKLERKFAGGVAGVMPLPKAGVKDVLKGKGIGGEFRAKWEASKASPAQLGALLTWCRENTLPLQASLTAHAILAEDPGRSEARQEAGFTADPVARMLEAEKQGGYISHEGRRWVPRELKEKLLRDGFALVDGQWFSRKERMIGVPGLFRYERQDAKPVLISGNGAALSHDIEYVYTPAQDLGSNSFVEKVEMKYLRRFWAPPLEVRQENGWPSTGFTRPAETPGYSMRLLKDVPIIAPGTPTNGEVYVTIPVQAPILEASVTTVAELKGTGSIVVSLIVDGRRERLYACQSREDKSHKLPDLIRGRTQVDLVAEFSAPAVYRPKVEKRKVSGPRKNDSGVVVQPGVEVAHARMIPEYQATLFASNSNTLEVFRLTVATAEPAPGLDKLFERAREILK